MIAQILLDPDICPVEDAETLAEYSGWRSIQARYPARPALLTTRKQRWRKGQEASRLLSSRSVIIAPSGDHSRSIEPPNCFVMTRLTSVLP